MKTIIVLAAVLATALSAPRKLQLGHPVGRITNGMDAALGQFPYQASMQFATLQQGQYSHVCGASIIAPDKCLTAGHCYTEVGNGYRKIRAGMVSMKSTDYQEIEELSHAVHELYQGGVGPNDIAVIYLKGSFILNNNVAVINLPPANYEATKELILSGWGSTSTVFLPSYPDNLQYNYFDPYTDQQCEALLAALNSTADYDPNSNMCVGPVDTQESACSGDSGGPLCEDDKQLGVVSWGYIPCGSPGAPSVFTQVSLFISWIIAN